MKTIRKRTLLELKDAIYKAHNRKRKAGESMSAFVKERYDVTVDHGKGFFVATPKKSWER